MDLILLIFGLYFIGIEARKRGLQALQWRLRLLWACLALDLTAAGISLYGLHKTLVVASITGTLAMFLAGLMIFQWMYKTAEQKAHQDDEQKED